MDGKSTPNYLGHDGWGYREKVFLKSLIAERLGCNPHAIERAFLMNFGNAVLDTHRDAVFGVRGLDPVDDAKTFGPFKVTREGTASKEILSASGSDDRGCGGDTDNKFPVHNRREAERLNADRGLHFFEPGTLRFFSSRIGEEFLPCYAAKASYFVTSEQRKGFGLPDAPRRYTVRLIDWYTGRVSSLGEFQAYETRSAAVRAMRSAVVQQNPF